MLNASNSLSIRLPFPPLDFSPPFALVTSALAELLTVTGRGDFDLLDDEGALMLLGVDWSGGDLFLSEVLPSTASFFSRMMLDGLAGLLFTTSLEILLGLFCTLWLLGAGATSVTAPGGYVIAILELGKEVLGRLFFK